MDLGQQTVEWRERNPILKGRMDKNLSVHELAEQSGVSFQKIMVFELGDAGPSEGEAKRIGHVLGIDDLAARFGKWNTGRPHVGVVPPRG